MRGVEPLSETVSTSVSTGVARLLDFPRHAADRRAARAVASCFPAPPQSFGVPVQASDLRRIGAESVTPVLQGSATMENWRH